MKDSEGIFAKASPMHVFPSAAQTSSHDELSAPANHVWAISVEEDGFRKANIIAEARNNILGLLKYKTTETMKRPTSIFIYTNIRAIIRNKMAAPRFDGFRFVEDDSEYELGLTDNYKIDFPAAGGVAFVLLTDYPAGTRQFEGHEVINFQVCEYEDGGFNVVLDASWFPGGLKLEVIRDGETVMTHSVYGHYADFRRFAANFFPIYKDASIQYFQYLMKQALSW